MIIYRENNLILTEKLKIFSESYEQKEFGIINKIRKSLANSINNSMAKDAIKLEESNNRAKSLIRKIRNKTNAEKAIEKETKRATDNHIKIIKNPGYSIPEAGISKEGSIISVSNYGNYPGGISHELEHIKNASGQNGRIAKRISELSGKAKPENDTTAKGIKTAVKNIVNNRLILQEERGASKRAIKALKKDKILNKEELGIAKEIQDNFNNTYKYEGSFGNKAPIRNAVDPDKNIEELDKSLEKRINYERNNKRNKHS